MNKKKIRMNHDKAADVLYILFGPSIPSYAEEISEGVYVRYSLEKDELTGITILDISERSSVDLINLISDENILSKDEADSLKFLH